MNKIELSNFDVSNSSKIAVKLVIHLFLKHRLIKLIDRRLIHIEAQELKKAWKF